MSGRGRGRGRGRGGGGPKTASQQYLHNSAQEAGIDVRHIRGASTAGGIFPALALHSSGERRLTGRELEHATSGSGEGGGDEVKKEGGGPAPAKPRSAHTIALVSKSRELHHRFQSAVFYVRSTKDVPDVVRYSDRLRPPPNIDASAVLSHCLGGKKRTRGAGGGVFVPEELCGGQRLGGPIDEEQRNKASKGLDLVALARKIRNEGGGGTDNADPGGGSGEEEDGGEFNQEQDAEESDGEDYAQNYYESEAEESKGSDGEPTF